nr:hypothetical protein [Streptomyces orinoci]
MMHSAESLEAELERLRRCPDVESAPPVLCEFSVEVAGDPAQYAQRLRSVLSAAVNLGATADFEEDTVPVDEVPDWFTAIGSTDDAQVPEFARSGRDAYTSYTGGNPWELQNWLYRFDSDDDSRGWEWWDITRAGRGKLHVWVDSWGEPSFGCQELRWAAYTAGAVWVEGPVVRGSEAWAGEESLNARP